MINQRGEFAWNVITFAAPLFLHKLSFDIFTQSFSCRATFYYSFSVAKSPIDSTEKVEQVVYTVDDDEEDDEIIDVTR